MAVTTIFKCGGCSQTFDVWKQTAEENFESSYKCPLCGNIDTWRVWGIGDFSVAGGMLGNSNNGYENNITPMPAKYGSFKGKEVKKIK
jgi:DNA-directed RNA polymerase subunit RPC12/RpoP